MIKNGKPVSKAHELQQLSDDLVMADTVLDKLGMVREVDTTKHRRGLAAVSTICTKQMA